ncbi:hypothetical protein [Nitrosopumilus sp.]|uniref:hypothetical protein n=1 Tax=Nitrosopumilus sp. TaxID=2024843 RepID=UPI00262A79BA|nr:hypothetical protein [Nitrosopumilus sp.]
MRIDSCRKCGMELEVHKKCEVCGDAIQFFCHKCGNISDEQIHSVCYLVNMNRNLLQASVA